MAGFFYLGGREGVAAAATNKQEGEDKEESLYLYRNEEIYNSNNKGFEIWPQNYYQQQQNVTNYSFGAGPSRRTAGFNLSDESSSRSAGFTVMRQGGMNCQDSEGFSAKRTLRVLGFPRLKAGEAQQLAALQEAQHQHNQQQEGQQQFREIPKRQRENQGVPSLACTRLSPSTSGLELGQFPPEVSSQAVFRCVKVSAMDDVDEEFAYQTVVSIAGHVFKGILYDQGPENRYSSGGESSQQLNLITAAAAATTTPVSTSSNPGTNMLDPSVYPAPLKLSLLVRNSSHLQGLDLRPVPLSLYIGGDTSF
ncbi:hypothetical protein F3Y22_tig00004004pilonHSYRG00025 [Hibiscus syriacus]|uniref:Protein SHI RELATED SEQUENCE 7 n=1 Tax=Hibiscus syriacus TaxID=106335 RepID=A0A6A3CPJ5_HIBSY|nr:hypothetical protein F3Y22_tig00004004pilonHSYRG00025 [Hibiscus syriacus]